MKLIVKDDPKYAWVDIPAFFVKAWVVMLALGALGHRLNIHQLYRVDYWDAALILLATVVFRNTGSSRKVVEGEK